MTQNIVFFIDVDNTLLDNDHIKEEIKNSLEKVLGKEEAEHFWQHHNSFRERERLVDFPNIIREYCKEKHKNTCELKLGQIFGSIDFSHTLYPNAIKIMDHLKKIGKVALFTEGDRIYQKRKIEESGLWENADEVILFKHKLEHLHEIEKRFASSKLVFIEDRADLLLKIKKQLPDSFVIEVCQGHYSTIDHKPHLEMDKTIDSIEELLMFKKEDF